MRVASLPVLEAGIIDKDGDGDFLDDLFGFGQESVEEDEESGGSLASNILGNLGHHVQYADGLSNEEISRVTLPSGSTMEVYRLECALKGGGTNNGVSVDLYDETNNKTLVSVTGGNKSIGDPIATSGEGAVILMRISTPNSGTPAFSVNGSTKVV